MVHNSRMQQQILSGQQKVDDVILRRPYCDAATDAKVTQNIQNFRITSEFFQQRNDDLDVLLFHHVQGLGGVVEDAVEDVHHAGAFTSQLAEEPVQTLGLGELGTVGVVASDDGS